MEEVEHSTAATKAHGKAKIKGVKLLPHEAELVASGDLANVTHRGASSIWLSANNSDLAKRPEMTRVYRPMGDLECRHLLASGVLPNTQPYQTIVEGDEGRAYAEKYLRGQKSVDSLPTTVIEFVVPSALVKKLWAIQCKPEDGALSHGLGNKGGKTLHFFNDSLSTGESEFRIVLVKRGVAKVK
eukprot:CAMPEP_0181292282 /NCGR_PEP_ID=MMETSP1101-20121128/2422_1 /TAXON_ID=46948 /ORGANISM="Rhodomonas abbreviata, Strain Caron Lab Isolate" /LENGTH=184 /DNA_ID=CAMNT_0023396739 /DNA_START=140 /DNA_END=694 /DNA_ORIENTATION=+